MKEREKFAAILTALGVLIAIGTIGYIYLLGVGVVDALYMVVITISTVGYGEVAIMTPQAKIFSMLVIFSGLGIAGYTFTTIMSIFVEGHIKEAWRRRKMESRISQLENHYIICGRGEMGQSVIQQFQKRGVDFVVIEKSEEKVNEILENGIMAIQGDATQEEVLQKAMIGKAKGLISSLSSDAENVFTVLTARELNENLHIVSRAIEKNSHEKIKKAGANNTVSPNEIGGTRMAALMLRPSVMAFLDVMTHAGDVVLDLEEVEICKGSDMIGKTLKQVRIPEKIGLIVLAIKKFQNQKIVFNPSYDEVLEAGDVMIVLGKQEQVDRLSGLVCKNSKSM